MSKVQVMADNGGQEQCDHRTIMTTGTALGVIVNCERCRIRFYPADHAQPWRFANTDHAQAGETQRLRTALRRIANHCDSTLANGSSNPDWAWDHVKVSEFARDALAPRAGQEEHV